MSAKRAAPRASWLDWRCGICRNTALERLRVARALWTLPALDAAFAAGELSYSKVRALTRVATERDEAALLAYARGASAAQVDAYCRRLRNGDSEASGVDAKRLHESRSLSRHISRVSRAARGMRGSDRSLLPASKSGA